MDHHSQILTSDHLDLLITAAKDWGVLASEASHALAAATPAMISATATEAGRQLQRANLQSITRQRTISPSDRLTLQTRPPQYDFTPVDHLVPLEVIKAAHAAGHLCSAAPHWLESTPARMLAATITAATHRLAGYASAPFHWSRPAARTGRPVAVGGSWRPVLPGLEWIGVDDVAEHWDIAPLVVVTSEVLPRLPVGLTPRAGVFTLDPDGPPPAVWAAATASPSSGMLFWPACRDWLTEQASAPAPEFAEYRPTG